MTKTLKGIAASDGIAIAPAYLLVEPDLSFSKSSISDVDSEVSRYKDAIKESTIRNQLLKLKRFVIQLRRAWVKKKPKFLKLT